MDERLTADARRAQDWWRSNGIAAPVLIPTDLAGLTYICLIREAPHTKPPGEHGLTLLLREEPGDPERQFRLVVRQEPAPGIHPILAMIPDLVAERAVPLHGATARLLIGGPNPSNSRTFRITPHGEQDLPHVPMTRLQWTREGIAYLIDAWGIAEERLLRVARSLCATNGV